MPARPDPDLLVLHALRLKGFARTDTIAASAGIDEPTATLHLEGCRGDGLVAYREGTITGWSLTAPGRQRHRDLLVAELEASGAREAVEAGYAAFREMNDALLGTCTAWQMKAGTINDHRDAAYDHAVLDDLRAIDVRIQPVCAELGSALDRFAAYGPRLAGALERVEAGERDWFTKPMIDSYHTVWFELHEDLLVTLGIERSKEVGV